MYRVYYQNKEPHDSEDGPPVGENARGVMVILQEDADIGWTSQSDADYYVNRDGFWVGTDINGLFDYLLDTGMVLFGRMIDRGEYSKIYSGALEDRDFGKKHGFLPRRYKERIP